MERNNSLLCCARSCGTMVHLISKDNKQQPASSKIVSFKQTW